MYIHRIDPSLDPRPRPRVRSILANELHDLIKEMCFRANTWDDAAACCNKIENFLKTKAKNHPEVLLEPSINKCSHFIDILHLPFVDTIQCKSDLRIAKSEAMFELLTDFCKAEAARNEDCGEQERSNLTWNAYANLMTKPNNDGFNPLIAAIASRSSELVEYMLRELTQLHNKKRISDEDFVAEFTVKTKGGYTPLLSAIESGNSEIYNYIASELFVLRRNHSISDTTYAEQFTSTDNIKISSIIHALKCNDTNIYCALSRKLKKLHKEGIIDNATFELQYTQAQSEGFTPLMAGAFSGNYELFLAIANDLKDMFRATSENQKQADEKFKEQLLKISSSNFNLFHCATWVKPEQKAPNPFLVDALLDQFYETFDAETARKHIIRLYREQTRTEFYETAYHDAQPLWLQKILSLSNERPVEPSAAINH